MTLGEQDIEFFNRFYDLLRLCIDAPATHDERTEVVRALLRGAVLGLCGSLLKTLPAEPATQGATGDLFQRFLDMLTHTEVKHRPVEYYASALCVSAKYLTVVCKKTSGRTAGQWIAEAVQEDIRYYLKTTTLSMKEIAHKLGFPNQSFFGKYVRTHFHMTPLQFRQS